MQLSDDQQRMLEGEQGEGVARAMGMLVKYGRAFDAPRLVPVDSVHVFSTDPVEFVEEMLAGVAGLRSTATTHSCYPAECRWADDMGIASELSRREGDIHERRVRLLMKAGFLPAFSCVPYLIGNLLRPGAVFSWPGSSGIIIGNSLFGGRGNRDASPAALCSAITGLTPEMSYLQPENRLAELIVRVQGIDWPSFSDGDFGALGYAIGSVAGSRTVALDGLPRDVSFEKLKYLLSPMPVSGAVSICHIVGVTPEAPTLESVVPRGGHAEAISIDARDVASAMTTLTTAQSSDVDLVVMGCPHCTIGELVALAKLLEGCRVHPDVRFWIGTSDGIYVLAKRMGCVDALERAGARLFTDVCLMNIPFGQLDVSCRVSATNSARAAHYHARGGLSGSGGVEVLHGSTERCVRAAVTGHWEGA